MPRWLNLRNTEGLKRSDQSPTNDEAISRLRSALTLHERRGERVRQMEDETNAGRAYWDVMDRNGVTVATYWLSDDDEGAAC